jgi:hypothetical protein
MRKITNTSKNSLLFPAIDFSIGPNEIKEVSEEKYILLRRSCFISEVIFDKNLAESAKVAKNKRNNKKL